MFFRCSGVKKNLKIKRFHIVRPEVEVSFEKPILGRLYFLFVLPRMFKVIKKKMNVGGYKLPDGNFVNMKPITFYFIGIPKIKAGGADD